MVDQAAPADDKRVVIYASGAGGTSPGAGGWGALLTHGDSQRELSGVEGGVTRDRMSLLAVVSALECLTRPTAVQVLTDNEYVRDGVAARTQGAVADDRNADLWTRLGAAVTRHRVQWVVVNAVLAARAAALAAAAASPAAPRAASPRPATPPRPATAPADAARPATPAGPDAARPVAPRPAPAAEAATPPAPAPAAPAAPGGRALPPEVVAAMRPASTLQRPTGERASLPFRPGDAPPAAPRSAEATPPNDVPPPKEATSPNDATPAADPTPVDGSVDEDGSLDENETDETDDMRDEFVEELRFWLEDETDDTPTTVDEWLRDTLLRIVDVTEESITFEDPTGRVIGPIPVPAGIAEQAEPGWRVRLTAARTGDAWRLRRGEAGTS